jgi:hypothetical protein
MSAAPPDSILARLDERFDRIEEELEDFRDVLTSRMDRHFMWLMGIMIVSILLPVVERFSVR